MTARRRNRASVWNTDLQQINSVKDLARSRFFWMPLLAVLSLIALMTDISWGAMGVSPDFDLFSAAFEVNIVKIVIGAALLFITFAMLQGVGRIIGGAVFLLAAVLFPSTGSIPVISNGVHIEFPIKLLYSLLFLSCWYVLTFYAENAKLSVVKAVKTLVFMAVLICGVCGLSVFFAENETTGATFQQLFKENGFQLHFAFGLACLLLAITFLRKGISRSTGAARIYSGVFFWGMVCLPAIISVYTIWGYIALDRELLQLPESHFTLEMTLLCACLWMFVIVYSMLRDRIEYYKNNATGGADTAKIERLRQVSQLPMCLFIAALLMSNVFFGARGVNYVYNADHIVNSWSVTFDLNAFKITAGIASIFVLAKFLHEKNRKIVGWAYFAIAVLAPFPAVVRFASFGTIIDLPVKLFYSAVFLTCWFMLSFNDKSAKIQGARIVKSLVGITLLLAGVVSILLSNTGMGSGSFSMVKLLVSNGLNTGFALGALFILLAITLLWRDFRDSGGPAKIVYELLMWCMIALPCAVAIYAIIGKYSFDSAMNPGAGQSFTTESALMLACLWMLMLFNSMIKFRKSQLAQASNTTDKTMLIQQKVYFSPAWNIAVQLMEALVLAALLFSDVFIGIRGVSFSYGPPESVWMFSIDLNLFKIALGIGFMIRYFNADQPTWLRVVRGWAFLALALFGPDAGVFTVVQGGIYTLLPIKTLYTALFLAYWLILTVPTERQVSALGRSVSALAKFTLLSIGLFEMTALTANMSSRAIAITDVLANNEYTLVALGFGLILLAVTLLKREVANTGFTAVILYEVAFWMLLIIPLVLSVCSIAGYFNLLMKKPLSSFSLFSLDMVVAASCLWSVLLFRSVYKRRAEDPTSRKDSYSILKGYFAEDSLKFVFGVPLWLFLISVPMCCIYALSKYDIGWLSAFARSIMPAIGIGS